MKTTQFFLVLISFTFSIGCSTDEIYEDDAQADALSFEDDDY